MAAYYDPTFNSIDYRHQTSKIILDYKDKAPLFSEIASDNNLMDIIREYQKVVNSRYGTVGGMIPYAEHCLNSPNYPRHPITLPHWRILLIWNNS